MPFSSFSLGGEEVSSGCCASTSAIIDVYCKMKSRDQIGRGNEGEMVRVEGRMKERWLNTQVLALGLNLIYV